MSSVLELPVTTLAGEATTLGALAGSKATLVVNVASRCGLTPQYDKLQALHAELAGQGVAVLGFPCNQFGAQEPGTPEEIAEFCSATYGVSFPMTAKVDVNGAGRDAIYAQLAEAPDADGEAGEIQWNFEKFLLDGAGAVVGRFRPRTEPDDPALRAALTSLLAGAAAP